MESALNIRQPLKNNFQHPIRGAIVISRILLEDEPIDSAEERAENVCHFLKSLPEANNMPVCVVVDDYFTTKEDTKIRYFILVIC